MAFKEIKEILDITHGYFRKISSGYQNSLDPDETPSYSASHLDPNCLQRTIENTEEEDLTCSEKAVTVHGETVVADLLMQELIKVGLASSDGKVNNTMNNRRTNVYSLDTETEVKYKKAVRQEENIRQSKERISWELEQVQHELSRFQASDNTEPRVCDVMPNGSRIFGGGGNRNLQPTNLGEKNTVDIIERVEKDSEILTKTLKLFNRKHKTLPSINTSENQ